MSDEIIDLEAVVDRVLTDYMREFPAKKRLPGWIAGAICDKLFPGSPADSRKVERMEIESLVWERFHAIAAKEAEKDLFAS
jgi:hypothetical protein